MDKSKVRCYTCNDLGHFANECKKPRRQDKEYLELKTRYEALLKKYESGKAYIAEGKCWDDSDNDEEEPELCNYALMAHSKEEGTSSESQVPILTTIDMFADDYKIIVDQLYVDMFNIHTSLTAANEEVTRVSTRNEKLIKRNEELELFAMQVENLKKEIEYLENKVLCANQIEVALREQLAENEFKLKAFKNASSMLQNIQENQGKTKIGIGFDYDTIRKKKGHADMSEEKAVHENAPHILKNASKPIFKPSTIDIDEEAILIKQLIIDEDEAQTSEQPTCLNTESVKIKTKIPIKIQSVKPVEPNTESAKTEGKKKKIEHKW